jgi:phage-related minor tail protein
VASLNEQIENYKKAGYDKDSEDYARAIRDKENLDKAHLEWTKEAANLQADMLKTPLQKLVKEWENTRKQVDQLSANWGRGFLNTFATQLIKGRADWRGFLSGMAEDVLKMQLDKTMGRAVEGVFDGLGSWLKGASASDKSATPSVNGAATAAAGGIGGLFDKAAGGLRDFWNSITGAGKAIEGLGNAAVDTALKTGSEIAGMSSKMMAEQNATTSLISLANAASAAAAAMGGSASGGGVGSGLGSLFGGLFGGGAGAANTDSIMNPQSGWDYQMSQMASPIQFAKGGIMTSMGPLPLNMYAGGGVVNSPQVAIFGEAGPEAYVPLPDGRSIPVTMNGGNNSGQATNITVNVVNQSGTPVQAKQQGQPRIDGKQIVLDIVLGAIAQPGPFRDGMKGALA